MTYQPYLISNFTTGFDKERQPWLLPHDAQDTLLDGYIYLGVWQKRQGYSQMATGQRGGSVYCESRMVHRLTGVALTGVINAVNQVFTGTLTTPVRRGTVTVNGTVPVQTFTDNGLGVFLDGITPIGTINYTTGALSITLPAAPTAGTVTVTYDYHPGLPVMAVMDWLDQTRVKQLIVCDTRYVNRYNPATNRLDDISPSYTFTGDATNFFSWTDYPDPNGLQRLLFVNFKDPIQQYSGSAVTPYNIYTLSNTVTATPSGVVGDGTAGPYTITTPANTGILPGSLTIDTLLPAPQTVTDDQFGNLQGDGTGTVDYLNGVIVVTFNAVVAIGDPIVLTYQQLTDPIDTALHIYQFKDRLVVVNIIDGAGVNFGLRILISGTGAFGDIFTVDAIGAGFIDIPDQDFILAGDFNRDDLILFTESSTWVCKYTGNDVVPFTLDKLDESRGSQAPYGTITYLNRTSAESTRGLITCDGYSVTRADMRLPDYSFNAIDQDHFAQCFAGAVDEDRDHYLIHPSPNNEISDVILVTNYQEDNFAVYRLPLSCMGNFFGSFKVTWNDLVPPTYNNWDDLARVYGNWNEFSFAKGGPFSVGGGHKGQITRLNVTELEDYPVKIRDITIIDDITLRVTTDFQQYPEGSFIFLNGIDGMVQANNKQAQIVSIVTANYTFDLGIDTEGFSAYTSGGEASQVIVFQSKTKKFNPFAGSNKKVRCGWVYFYVSTTGTNLTINRNIFGASKAVECVINSPNHGYTTGTQVYIDGVQGMTELNGLYYFITVIDANNFSLDFVNSTGFTTYTGSGFTSVPDPAKLLINVIVNDTEEPTLVQPFPQAYEVNLTSEEASQGIKKWYKLFINQVGRFVQFEVINAQAGAKIEIQAIMPGLLPTGRLI